MKRGYLAGAAAVAYLAVLVPASQAEEAEGAAETAARSTIIVTGARQTNASGTKTDTPVLETPQPVTVITADTYLAQGAVSISDTLNYVAGVQSNPYGSDSRVDGGFIRGINPIQFRDGMHDIYSYYASIRSDPYNFSRVEVVRGPASVLFGSGSIGGLLNMVSKDPQFKNRGEFSLRYGTFDRKEVLADVNTVLTDGLAGRIVARVRDAGTQTDHVPDDRVMIAPSLRWQPTPDTDVELLGLYQEDDSGSTAQFLPNVGTILPNPNGKLANSLFIGKPGWDRYDGRLLQGTGTVSHRFSEAVRINLKARYIDSDLTYLTHYPDSYGNPANPYIDPDQRVIGLYADGSIARMEIFTTDNNIQFDFHTGDRISHKLLAGIDYSWNRVRKTGGYGYEFIDIYNIDYDALSDYGGGIPTASDPNFIGGSYEDTAQKQLGVYVQDQVRLYDRVSIVVGARRDHVSTRDTAGAVVKDNATTFRAGIIGDVLPFLSPFFSYTQSFEPISGTASDGNPFKPKRGRQFEGGIKLHPDERTLITATAFHIRENNRPVDDASTPDPFDQRQAGALTSKGFEIEATRILPGDFELIANYSYTRIREAGSRQQLEDVAKHNASLWTTKTLRLDDDTAVRLGSGVRYTGAHVSGNIRTPGYTLVDALVELTRGPWTLAVNATNLFDKEYYASCLGRGDCFVGAERNVFGTVSYRF
ncbi:TonB-dependent siderophore receptor [Novosphingobium colocasiae]|uniref:TonB-dependent siderophore receptor n=1 Tax=Novosphingobium colocasiae TaxID=1256513 RepID=UPI0035AEE59A